MIKNSGYIGHLYQQADDFKIEGLMNQWRQLFGDCPPRRTIQHWLKLAVEQGVFERQGHRYTRRSSEGNQSPC